MDYYHLAILLLVFGIGLLVAEIFLPSGGLLMVASLICLGGSMWCAWQQWWEESRTLWWTYLGIVLLLIPAAAGGALYVFPRTPMGKRLLLEAPDPDEVNPYSEQEEEQFSQLIGKRGETITLLNPGGLVLLNGERMHSESEGMWIEPNTEVKVVNVKGNRLVVRPAPPRSKDQKEDFPGENGPTSDAPLDFDLT